MDLGAGHLTVIVGTGRGGGGEARLPTKVSRSQFFQIPWVCPGVCPGVCLGEMLAARFESHNTFRINDKGYRLYL